MQRLPTAPDVTPITLFNPSLESFTFVYDKKEYMLFAYSADLFPKYIADRLASKLADAIIAKRGVVKNHELDRQELLKEIYV